MLIYNLYITEPAGSISPDNRIVQPQSLPLYGLKDLMSEEEFITQGCVLGVYYSHFYVYNLETVKLYLSKGLMGADIVLCI
ncbi:hypothetical protein V1509DRAFT_627493 [Lipomyces kononenkoae]